MRFVWLTLTIFSWSSFGEINKHSLPNGMRKEIREIRVRDSREEIEKLRPSVNRVLEGLPKLTDEHEKEIEELWVKLGFPTPKENQAFSYLQTNFPEEFQNLYEAQKNNDPLHQFLVHRAELKQKLEDKAQNGKTLTGPWAMIASLRYLATTSDAMGTAWQNIVDRAFRFRAEQMLLNK